MPSHNETAIHVTKDITVAIMAHMAQFAVTEARVVGTNAATIFDEVFKKVANAKIGSTARDGTLRGIGGRVPSQ